MREIDELRPLTALRLLTLWRESGCKAEEAMERALLCNAAVLAESCFFRKEPVFQGAEAVLEMLTPHEMEVLLRRLVEGKAAPEGAGNPAFDAQRFRALQEGRT